LWGIATWTPEIHVVMPNGVVRSYPGITAHRQLGLGEKDRREVASIPVTDPANTLIDIACGLPDSKLEKAIREADRLDLVDPERLRARLDTSPRRPGIGRLRKLLDSETFALTDSELERRFLRLIATADLPLPKTQVWLNGYRVDFYWPELGLVVETDGLRYHQTPSQQKKDRLRDQSHAAAGLIPLRFTAAQVRFEPKQTMATLIAVASRLQSTR
jgi:very-short-patch-repair endonuclease